MRLSLVTSFLLLPSLNQLRADDHWGPPSNTKDRPPQIAYIEKRLKYRDTSFRAVAVDSPGDLKITFEVPRVVAMRRAPVDLEVPDTANPVQDGEGFLLPEARQYLVDHSLLSPTATIRIYLKYTSGNPKDNGKTFQIKKISLNGKVLDTTIRTAQIGIWRPTPITLKNVPIEKLRFGRWQGDSAEPIAGQNDIEITSNMQDFITPLNGEETCEVIPIGLVEFGAVAPILMVHGLRGNADKWMEPATLNYWDGQWLQWNSQYECFLDYFLGFRTWKKNDLVNDPSTQGASPYLAPWSNRISLGKSNMAEGLAGIQADASELSRFFPKILKSFGAKKTHIVAHSKGGLDTRAYLNWPEYQQKRDDGEIEILSLYTLATPHHGSALAPVMLAGGLGYSDDPNIQTLFDKAPAWKLWLASMHLKNKGLQDLVPATTNSIVGSSLPSTRHFYNLAADADVFDANGLPNPDGRIQVVEGYGQLDEDKSPSHSDSKMGNAQYWLLRNVAEVNVESSWHNRNKVVIKARTPSSQPNDLLVPQNSALLSTAPGNLLKGKLLIRANHGTAKHKENAKWIVDQITQDFPVTAFATEKEAYD